MHEDLTQIKAFLKRAVDLEGVIYTCDRTEQELKRRLDAIDNESRTVTEYKDGDLIPYEDFQYKPNRVYPKQTLAGTKYESDYDRMPADYKRFHSISDMTQGYSCPKKLDSSKGVGQNIASLIAGMVGGTAVGAIPGGIIGVVYGFYYGIRHGYRDPWPDMPLTMLKTAVIIALLCGIAVGIWALIGEIKRDPNAPDEGYEKERAFYVNKLRERNAKLTQDHDLMKYCETHFPKLSAMRARAKKDLEAHYANSPIFPKYHNFIAVAQILEYFESGRCDTLAGADGAYNLYESELRQNIIIAHLENISQTLEQVRDTQYLIYRELMVTNNLLGAIDQDLQNLQRSVDANTDAIVAYGSQISEKLNW